jgi:hypothetical protein
MRNRIRLALAALGLLAGPAALASLAPEGITHADFVRQAGTDAFAGLDVQRRTASDADATWNLWRIANPAKPDGPLWVVPHDNENAAFAAALRAVKSYGGIVIAVDSEQDDRFASARYVRAHDGGRLDPNRTFTAAWPAYVSAVLADRGNRPIVALHTNAPGFDGGASTCGDTAGNGSGGISIRLCNSIFSPRPAADRSWPWDDDDSVVISPYLAGAAAGSGWCGARLIQGNFNILFERVATSDGSLSNYAVQHGIPYLNFETQDRGSDPAGIAAASARLTAMIDAAMERCLAPRAQLVAAAGGDKEAR